MERLLLFFLFFLGILLGCNAQYGVVEGSDFGADDDFASTKSYYLKRDGRMHCTAYVSIHYPMDDFSEALFFHVPAYDFTYSLTYAFGEVSIFDEKYEVSSLAEAQQKMFDWFIQNHLIEKDVNNQDNTLKNDEEFDTVINGTPCNCIYGRRGLNVTPEKYDKPYYSDDQEAYTIHNSSLTTFSERLAERSDDRKYLFKYWVYTDSRLPTQFINSQVKVRIAANEQYYMDIIIELIDYQCGDRQPLPGELPDSIKLSMRGGAGTCHFKDYKRMSSYLKDILSEEYDIEECVPVDNYERYYTNYAVYKYEKNNVLTDEIQVYPQKVWYYSLSQNMAEQLCMDIANALDRLLMFDSEQQITTPRKE